MTRCARNLFDGRGPDRIVNGMEIMLHAPARHAGRHGDPGDAAVQGRGVSRSVERRREAEREAPLPVASAALRVAARRLPNIPLSAPSRFWYPHGITPEEPPMTKDEVAAALDEIGTLLELKGENAFRANAYHNAARTVQQLDGDLKQMVAEKKLGEVRGIGETLREKITTLVTTGQLPYLEELRASIPAGAGRRCCGCPGSGRRR